MRSAMDIGVVVGIKAGNGVYHALRLLGCSAVIQPCKRFAMHQLVQGGEILADGSNIQRTGPRFGNGVANGDALEKPLIKPPFAPAGIITQLR